MDLTKRRVVDEGEGRLWAESRGFHYFETSAQSGEGINEMFQVYMFTHIKSHYFLLEQIVLRICVCIRVGILLIHHWHVWERWKATSVGGQCRLHERAGRHHPTHTQQQGLLGYAWCQTWCHAVCRQPWVVCWYMKPVTSRISFQSLLLINDMMIKDKCYVMSYITASQVDLQFSVLLMHCWYLYFFLINLLASV